MAQKLPPGGDRGFGAQLIAAVAGEPFARCDIIKPIGQMDAERVAHRFDLRKMRCGGECHWHLSGGALARGRSADPSWTTLFRPVRLAS